MAYKRISPMPIVEGGTNTKVFANTYGTVYYDGTELNNVNPGTAGYILTSNGGGGSAPSFQAAGGAGGNTFFISDQARETYQNRISGYFAPFGTGEGTTTSIGFVCPFNCTLSNMFTYIVAVTTPGTEILTVYVNGSPTSLSVTLTGIGVFSDTTHTAAVSAGDVIAFVVTPNALTQLTGGTSLQVTI